MINCEGKMQKSITMEHSWPSNLQNNPNFPRDNLPRQSKFDKLLLENLPPSYKSDKLRLEIEYFAHVKIKHDTFLDDS